MENQQYPEWQRAFREAQAAKRAAWLQQTAADDERRQQKRMEEEAQLGADLHRALALLGVEVEKPASNAVVLSGGYIVWLSSAITEGQLAFNDPRSCVRFALHIKRLACPPAPGYDWFELYAEASNNFQIVEGKVTPNHLAAFADLLDAVDSRVEDRQRSRAQWHEEQEQEERWAQARRASEQARIESYRHEAPPQSEPTKGEQLEALIRRIIQEERDAYLDF